MLPFLLTVTTKQISNSVQLPSLQHSSRTLPNNPIAFPCLLPKLVNYLGQQLTGALHIAGCLLKGRKE